LLKLSKKDNSASDEEKKEFLQEWIFKESQYKKDYYVIEFIQWCLFYSRDFKRWIPGQYKDDDDPDYEQYYPHTNLQSASHFFMMVIMSSVVLLLRRAALKLSSLNNLRLCAKIAGYPSFSEKR